MAGLPAEAAAPTSGRFVDDDRHPAEAYLDRLADMAVIHGCDPPANRRACPDDLVTRAEAAKIVVELGAATAMLPEPAAVPAGVFADDDAALAGGAPAYTELLAALGAVHGCNPPANDRFCPGRTVTRGEAAKVIVGAYRLTAPDDFALPWGDAEGSVFEEAARVVAYHGMWSTRTTFGARQRLTRGELAQAVLEGAGIVLCRPDPFGDDRLEELADRYPGRSLTAHVYDLRTGCSYRLNPDNRQSTASVFKVMVMAGTLHEAQEEGRPVTGWEMSRLEPMITESANPPVRALWSSFGGSPWFRRQADIFGLDDTTVRGDDGSAWGLTSTSAADQVDLLRQVLLGEWGPLESESREVALDLMTSVVASQTWGVTAGVPADWTVAQKNGFAGITINSVGWVDEPGDSPGYLVAILTRGWPDHPSGIAAVERINRWVAESMTADFAPTP